MYHCTNFFANKRFRPLWCRFLYNIELSIIEDLTQLIILKILQIKLFGHHIISLFFNLLLIDQIFSINQSTSSSCTQTVNGLEETNQQQWYFVSFCFVCVPQNKALKFQLSSIFRNTALIKTVHSSKNQSVSFNFCRCGLPTTWMYFC